ncbi:MAG: SpoIIE family protein phosphatase [Ignavibacteriales bacterium]|nr:SpoIIE family protein phosphatase [Ignavibacteriales bacterium]
MISRLREFRREIRREFRELCDTLLDAAHTQRLQSFGRFRRGVYIVAYLFKDMIGKLSATRRILIIIALVLSANIQIDTDGESYSTRNSVLPTLIFLWIVALELKDKLLMRGEIDAARKIQSALMPDRTPAIDGWSIAIASRAANNVGGDLVDYIPLENGHALLVLADICGKGLSAALLTAKLQTVIRTISLEQLSLADLAARVNRAFRSECTAQMFASLVIAEIVPGKPAIQWINAGHLPPFIIRQGIPSPSPKGEVALGLLVDAAYNPHSLQLAKGESFVIYSDGAVDARNERGIFFGTDRFTASLVAAADKDAAATIQSVLSIISSFVDDAPMHDDISLVVMKYIGGRNG